MKTIESEEIRLEREILKKRLNMLDNRERKLYKHESDATSITADEALMKSDINPAEVNYILGHSKGFVDGFGCAVNTIIEALSSEYRDIRMTEDELYTLVELGRIRERTWLKDFKQQTVIEKAGWFFDFGARCPVWKKKEEKNED